MHQETKDSAQFATRYVVNYIMQLGSEIKRSRPGLQPCSLLLRVAEPSETLDRLCHSRASLCRRSRVLNFHTFQALSWSVAAYEREIRTLS